MNILKMLWAYLKSRGHCYLPCFFTGLAFNLYYIFLLGDKNASYLYYLDFLLLTAVFLWEGIDFGRFCLREREVICRLLPPFANREIAEHDVRVLEGELREQFEENCEMQDYVAKWCHELKVPLAAALLLDERIREGQLRGEMREQLERMNRLVSSLLLGCKLQSSLLDVQIREVVLEECVRESIRNNQFFLIQKGFQPEISVGEHRVYTDPSWLVYILDQLLSNAVKYTGLEPPRLRIWTGADAERLFLYVEDNGEGIRDCDLRRVFEKGFTGSGHHNGKYKSTGMGLYMVSRIIEKLGHEISVESVYGEYTRFRIDFGTGAACLGPEGKV